MTDLYHTTKVAAAAIEWREFDKNKTTADAALTDLVTDNPDLVKLHVDQKQHATRALNKRVKKLRAAVDELAKKGGRP